MSRLRLSFFPLAMPFILLFFLVIVVLIFIIEIGVIEYAYERIGIDRRYVFGLLLLSLLGSCVNIPIAELPAERVLSNQQISFFGVRYVIPFVKESPRTVIAVNFGGAIVPTLLSVYLLMKNGMVGQSLVAIAVVTIVVHWVARPILGVGIAVPMFVPSLAATATALFLSTTSAPALAYIAGTFDGIFLTGIIAVLLA